MSVHINYRPKRSWDKVMFLHVSVILFMAGVVSQHALQVVSQHALQVSRGLGCIPACLAVSRPTPGGSFRGLTGGGSPGPHPGGEVEGSGLGGRLQATPGGVSRPTPGGGLQVHTYGVFRSTPGGRSPGPHPGGLQAHTILVSKTFSSQSLITGFNRPISSQDS